MLKLLLASILCITGFTLIACDDADETPTTDNRTAGEKVADAGEKAGDALETAAEKTGEALGKITDETVQLARETREQGEQAAEASGLVPNDAKAIQNVVAELAEAAMLPGKYGEIVERLAEPDRQRIGDYAAKDHPDLADITAKAAAAWQKAYGESFDIDDASASFGGSAVTLSPDGKTATMPFADFTLRFVREPGEWRLDAPDALTGEGLKNALIQRLDAIGNGTTGLPKDETDGHLLVAQKVVGAIMTTDQPESPAVQLR
ncbi:MAG TPA: hypothetical protein VGR35_11115 [Tepidisphaeraceae bacterium]|nr:hypothetical protein [Tepidisphaeraceae bacterium]